MHYYLSLSKLSGYFEPGGKSGFSSGLLGFGGGLELDAFEEFPAFPDLTMPRFGGISYPSKKVFARKRGLRDDMSRPRASGFCDVTTK